MFVNWLLVAQVIRISAIFAIFCCAGRRKLYPASRPGQQVQPHRPIRRAVAADPTGSSRQPGPHCPTRRATKRCYQRHNDGHEKGRPAASLFCARL